MNKDGSRARAKGENFIFSARFGGNFLMERFQSFKSIWIRIRLHSARRPSPVAACEIYEKFNIFISRRIASNFPKAENTPIDYSWMHVNVLSAKWQNVICLTRASCNYYTILCIYIYTYRIKRCRCARQDTDASMEIQKCRQLYGFSRPTFVQPLPSIELIWMYIKIADSRRKIRHHFVSWKFPSTLIHFFMPISFFFFHYYYC